MKRITMYSLCAAGMLGLLGCGGSGGASVYIPYIAGQWSRGAIGKPGQIDVELTRCPGTVTVEGAAVTCASGDRAWFNGNYQMWMDLVDAPTGRRMRVWASYSDSGSQITITPTSVGTDYDNDGTYTSEETVTASPSLQLAMNVLRFSDTTMFAEVTLNGQTHTVLYVKTQ